LAASLKRRFGVESTLVRGSRGIFDVRFGDELVFSKYDVDRFPKPGEVETLLQSRLAPGA
jgi:hypothetical protein